MFASGKIYLDRTGEVKKLVNLAKKELVKNYPKLNKTQIELLKYQLWDICDNLEEVYESKNLDFSFVYFNNLYTLFEIYSGFLKYDLIKVNKLKRFLTNQRDKEKSSIKDFPDKDFVKLYLNALKIKNELVLMKDFKILTNYVLNKMGGFDVDGWKIRTSLN
jgi:hypothetical protein